MKKSPFKSTHQSRKVTCEKCGETFDRFFYEKIHKEVCSGRSPSAPTATTRWIRGKA
ncbi:MAG TPA: hypothetical protein VGS11_07235 [Candidatus Bathyarchaeia archaeon]|nr:hypothetical protein [Candidatus Bathyarchaeia archaeon]